MKKLLAILAAGAFASAYSSTWHEAWHGTGDTGDLPASAQVTVGTAGLTSLIGSAGSSTDGDMYKIKIVAPASFGASTAGGSTSDTQLFLFKSDGTGVASNDDNPAGGFQSVLTSAFTASLAVDNYYLAITIYNRDPQDGGAALIWLNAPFNVERAPDGPGAANPIASWSGTSGTGTYTIALTGCDPSIIGADEVDPGQALASISISPSPVFGGAPSTGTATLTAPAGSDITVTLVSSNPAVASVPASVLIATSTSSNTFAITTFAVVVSTSVNIDGTYNAVTKTGVLQVDPAGTLPPNSWNEDHPDYQDPHGDAGNTIATAQHTVGNGALTAIYGQTAAGDADMWCITITDPATFGASTVGNATMDTQLFLFKPDGTGIASDDDDPAGGNLQSVLTSAFTASLTAGPYYLAFSGYDNDPVDAGALDLWLDTPFNVERAPDGAGAANPMAAWAGASGATGKYKIDLTGCGYCDPATVTVLPTSFTTSPGVLLNGTGLAEALTSDDIYMVVRPGVVFSNATDPVQVNFIGNAPGATSSDLKVVVEARASSNNIRMFIQAYRYTGTPGYITVGTVNPLPFGGAGDSVSTITLVAADNIGAGNEMRVKLSCRATAAVFSYPWKLNVDQVKWLYNP